MRHSNSLALSCFFVCRPAAVFLRLCLNVEMTVQLSRVKLLLLALPSGDDGLSGDMVDCCLCDKVEHPILFEL